MNLAQGERDFRPIRGPVSATFEVKILLNYWGKISFDVEDNL